MKIEIEVLEFIRLAKKLRDENRESFIELKGYLKGLLYRQQRENKDE